MRAGNVFILEYNFSIKFPNKISVTLDFWRQIVSAMQLAHSNRKYFLWIEMHILAILSSLWLPSETNNQHG